MYCNLLLSLLLLVLWEQKSVEDKENIWNQSFNYISCLEWEKLDTKTLQKKTNIRLSSVLTQLSFEMCMLIDQPLENLIQKSPF